MQLQSGGQCALRTLSWPCRPTPAGVRPGVPCTLTQPPLPPVQFLGACTKKEPYILVTELMTGGSLADAFKLPEAFPMRRALEVALDAARGLAYLHNRQPTPVIHRDLKPGNLMLSGSMYQDTKQIVFNSGTVKIADFGLSKTLPTNRHVDFELNDRFKLTGETGAPRGGLGEGGGGREGPWGKGRLAGVVPRLTVARQGILAFHVRWAQWSSREWGQMPYEWRAISKVQPGLDVRHARLPRRRPDSGGAARGAHVGT